MRTSCVALEFQALYSTAVWMVLSFFFKLFVDRNGDIICFVQIHGSHLKEFLKSVLG